MCEGECDGSVVRAGEERREGKTGDGGGVICLVSRLVGRLNVVDG